MNYLIGYLVIGTLFMVPFVLQSANKAKAAIFAACTLSLWPFLFAAFVLGMIRANYYSCHCAFCGEEFEAVNEEDRDAAIREHIMRCPEHPMRKEIEAYK